MCACMLAVAQDDWVLMLVKRPDCKALDKVQMECAHDLWYSPVRPPVLFPRPPGRERHGHGPQGGTATRTGAAGAQQQHLVGGGRNQAALGSTQGCATAARHLPPLRPAHAALCAQNLFSGNPTWTNLTETSNGKIAGFVDFDWGRNLCPHGECHSMMKVRALRPAWGDLVEERFQTGWVVLAAGQQRWASHTEKQAAQRSSRRLCPHLLEAWGLFAARVASCIPLRVSRGLPSLLAEGPRPGRHALQPLRAHRRNRPLLGPLGLLG